MGHPRGLDEVYAGTAEPVRLAAASVSRARSWPLFDREPLDAWLRGRVVLLGDAAHPMLQVLGNVRRHQVKLVVIDTDVASSLLRRRTSDALAQALAGHILAITFRHRR